MNSNSYPKRFSPDPGPARTRALRADASAPRQRLVRHGVADVVHADATLKSTLRSAGLEKKEDDKEER
jgi:hypothetical protein